MEALELDTNRVIGLYAGQNYGKSFLTKWLITQIAPHVPVFIYDTNFEGKDLYAGIGNNVFLIKSIKKSEMELPKTLNDAILKLRAKSSNFFIVIEDLDKILNHANRTDDTLEIFKLASDSRHQRIGIIYLTKEPTNIPVKLRSNTNLFFFGSFIEPSHLKYIGEIVDKATIKRITKPTFLLYDRLTQTQTKVQLHRDELEEV